MRGFMDLLNKIFPNRVTMRTWAVLVATTLALSACLSRGPTNSPPHYFWDSNLQTKQIHAAVACNSLRALLTFNRLYASGTAKDKLEEATLLGESSFYASDAPPDPPCRRAGHPPIWQTFSWFYLPNITAPGSDPSSAGRRSVLPVRMGGRR